MLIKFSVLWIEDDTTWFEASQKVLKRHLDSLGFHLVVKRISDPENTDWEAHFESTSQYDLMLVDWRIEDVNKADKAIGGEVIAKIQEQVLYSDIIFYSGDSGLEDEVHKNRLQGVYTAQRRHVGDEAKALIDHLLHKTLHPKIMRGIIVSSLSQIDDMCFKIIEHKFSDGGCDKAEFAKAFRSSLDRQAKSRFKSVEKLAKLSDDEFVAGLHSTLVLESSKRAQKVVELTVDDIEGERHAKLLELPDTIQKRNWLAHWKHLEENDTQIILAEIGRDNYVFDQDESTRMRKKINEAGEVLAEYLKTVSAKTTDAC